MNKNKLQKNLEEFKRWKPKDGDNTYIIDIDGKLMIGKYEDNFSNQTALRLGNIFKTLEEANKERNRRLAEVELLDMCDFNSGDIRCFVIYNSNEDMFEVNSYMTYRFINPYVFATRESCQKAINKLGKEKLKLIFRIEEINKS